MTTPSALVLGVGLGVLVMSPLIGIGSVVLADWLNTRNVRKVNAEWDAAGVGG